ncbi:hypothetical protein B0H34DRAFT_736754 [Crassisporium funariophilum]|nr:hypothetical protein B0H34DRAFT_736754 [Crassisporium funariophilum]
MVTRIDDTDRSIVYSSGWEATGGPDEYQETTMSTSNQGASATVSFSGTQISVFGTIADKGLGDAPTSSYRVDGGSAKTVVSTLGNNIQYGQLFYNSGRLAAGQHTLVITYTGQSSFFYLDYIEIENSQTPPDPQPPNPQPPNTQSPALAQSSLPPPVPDITFTTSTSTRSTPSVGTPTTNTASLQLSTTTAANGSTVTAFTSSSSNKSISIGAIAGGVGGGLFFLILLVALLFCLRRKKTADAERNASGLSTIASLWSRPRQMTQSTPFQLSAPAAPLVSPTNYSSADTPFSDTPPSSSSHDSYSIPYLNHGNARSHAGVDTTLSVDGSSQALPSPEVATGPRSRVGSTRKASLSSGTRTNPASPAGKQLYQQSISTSTFTSLHVHPRDRRSHMTFDPPPSYDARL